ncbi:protein translocase subunit SecF [Alterisphingorhabdus coralli]|uniref:Protein-export membrane protein SecF n=1 Tax=Alterisphingorhabdus coralli TaxID=3071408 RepID=A0AA97HZX0_9SPHN|nr:protein translocase subunit SecF [Parasphingorhabdus sp. SCSIO 66989]WOE74282.1 protein translocase subunit SecF [Parasphingorhabdus sp. SCSIO 66989]
MKLLKLVPEKTNIGFLKLRNVAVGFSVLLIIASIALVMTRGLNFGVDFVGGQQFRVTFEKVEEAPIVELRESIAALNLGDANIQRFGEPNEVAIRMRLNAEGGDELQEADSATVAVSNMIEERFAEQGVRIDGVDAVSGKVSEELLSTGVYSLVFALIAISIYIWFRFEWQFGVGALFALFHDVALTFGFFALTQLEFNLNIIAALLTIIGYSLNDTIVIDDRIRENLRKYRKMEISNLLDLSINETLARTVSTSLTMIIVLVSLVLLGPDVIFGFSAAMLFGVIIGTYSSIYIASPVLIWLGVGPDSFVPVESDSEKAQRRLAEGYDGAEP